MKKSNNKMIVTVIAIAVVVIIALWLTTQVNVNIDDGKLSLSADKNKQQDEVTVKDINKSQVDVENRKDQNIHVEGVTNESKINVK